MPATLDVDPIDYPVNTKFGQEISLKIIEQLSHIKVTLIDAPAYWQLTDYIPEYSTATWSDKPNTDLSSAERVAVVDDMLDGLVLPAALETVGLTFRIEGMDLTDATHLIRHRAFSFSAQCTGDRDLRHDNVMGKPGIMTSLFFSRYQKLMRDAMQLYADMVDSRDVSIMDARSVLPRALESFYYARGNLKDVIGFIHQRLDEQIQPMSDNVIAMRMAVALCSVYPRLAKRFIFGGRDEWYIKTARTGRNSNIYPPKPENDVFDYHPKDFLYDKRRDEFKGATIYESIKAECQRQLSAIEETYNVSEIQETYNERGI